MTSSTCFCSLNSHTKLDSLMVVWDATGLSFDCQTNVLQLSRPRASVTCFVHSASCTPTSNSVSPHNHCANRSKTVSHYHPALGQIPHQVVAKVDRVA